MCRKIVCYVILAVYDKKLVKLFGEPVEVNAKILNLPGISGHADKQQLTDWAGAVAQNTPKKFFIVHGEGSIYRTMR